MDRTPVASSNVAAIGYADDTLEVEFRPDARGVIAIYRYSPIEEGQYRLLIAGDVSAGKYIAGLRHQAVTTVRVCAACQTEVDPKDFKGHACAAALPVAEVA